MSKKSYFKIIILGIILIAMVLPFIFGVGILFADTETLTISKLLGENYKGQEITNNLEFSTNFEYEGEDDGGLIKTEGWKVPVYDKNESLLLNTSLSYNINNNSLYVADLISEGGTFLYSDKTYNFKSAFGADGEGNTFGLFFLTNDESVLGAEVDLKIPSQAIYVLTFKIKIGEAVKSKGLNAKIIDGDNVYTMSAITSTSSTYKTYAFLIRGHQFEEKTVQLQLLWGNITKNSDDTYVKNGELGYAVVDTIQLFSVNHKQYEDLSTVSANKQVDLFSASNYELIANGYFNQTENANWKLDENTKLMDFLPTSWTQETAVTSDSSRVAHYGVVNTGSSRFNTLKLNNSELNLINPGIPSTSSVTNNNVLVLYNGNDAGFQNTYQSITSAEFTLQKKSYYEISFKFNTPALKNSAEEENNSLNFYIIDSSGKTIYSREDMFSYTEWSENANEWETFRVFIKTSDDAKKLKFVITLGTEENTKSGYAYIDEINRSVAKSSGDKLFNNTKNNYVLKGTVEEDVNYLETGLVSFTDLANIDFSSELISTTGENRSLGLYDYTASIVVDPEDEEEDDSTVIETGSTTNLDYLWYVIPSILLGTCVVLGLVIFYGRKVKSKIKFPKRRKKNSYDRRKTLNKQVSARESSSVTTNDIENQLKAIKTQITKLESTYKKAKSNPSSLKNYIKQREKLQNQELRLKEKLNKK